MQNAHHQDPDDQPPLAARLAPNGPAQQIVEEQGDRLSRDKGVDGRPADKLGDVDQGRQVAAALAKRRAGQGHRGDPGVVADVADQA